MVFGRNNFLSVIFTNLLLFTLGKRSDFKLVHWLRDKDFFNQIYSLYISYWAPFSPSKWAWPFSLTNLSALHQTILWQTLIEINPVVLENKSKMWKVCWRTDDGQTGDQKISHTSAKTLSPELDAVSKTLWIWHWGRKWTSFWDHECRQHIGSWWKVHVPNVILM